MAASLFSPSLPVRSPPPPYALLSSTAQRSGFCNCWISRCRRGTRVGGLRSRGEFGVRTPRGDQRLQRSRACFMKVSCKVDVIEEGEFAEKVLGSDVPVLVEFVATWCGPCRLIAPAVESAAEEYKEKLKIVKIDHDSNPKLIEEYKVYGLPTLILFRNGQEVPQSRREGAITKVKLKEYLDAQLEAISAR